MRPFYLHTYPIWLLVSAIRRRRRRSRDRNLERLLQKKLDYLVSCKRSGVSPYDGLEEALDNLYHKKSG